MQLYFGGEAFGVDKIKITKVPDDFNLAKMIRENMTEEYCTSCPYCWESKPFERYLLEDTTRQYKNYKKGIAVTHEITWYGLRDRNSSIFHWANPFRKEKDRHWVIKHCVCYTCGCEWDSPPMPND